LKTNAHPVYGVPSEALKTPQNRYPRSSRVLTRQKCGRTFLTLNAIGSSWHSCSEVANRFSKALQSAFSMVSEMECLCGQT
jgi:hypothetical protein